MNISFLLISGKGCFAGLHQFPKSTHKPIERKIGNKEVPKPKQIKLRECSTNICIYKNPPIGQKANCSSADILRLHVLHSSTDCFSFVKGNPGSTTCSSNSGGLRLRTNRQMCKKDLSSTKYYTGVCGYYRFPSWRLQRLHKYWKL